jgi:hypothetical protein
MITWLYDLIIGNLCKHQFETVSKISVYLQSNGKIVAEAPYAYE